MSRNAEYNRVVIKNRIWKSRWFKAAFGMASVVVFVTVYALILPAITMEYRPACGLEEHTHTDECYEMQQVLICGMEASEAHTHTEDCYETRRVLICGKEEHCHMDACYPRSKGDATADLETEETWTHSFSMVVMTEDARRNLISVAESQIGYGESAKNFIDDNGQRRGYTRYGAWYGDPYGDWNAMFVSFCLHYAGIDTWEKQADCARWLETLQSDTPEMLLPEGGSPTAGDLVFFDTDRNGDADHVAVISRLLCGENGEIQQLEIIEGQKNRSVAQTLISPAYDTILCYAAPVCAPAEERADDAPQTAEEPAAPIDAEQAPELPAAEAGGAPDPDTIELVAVTSDGTKVTVSGPAAAFPAEKERMRLVVTKPADTEENRAAFQQCEQLENRMRAQGTPVKASYLYDLKVETDGAESELRDDVKVTFEGVDKYLSAVYHVSENQIEPLTVLDEADGDVAFVTNHFSLFELISLTDDSRVLRSEDVETTSLVVKKSWSDTWNSHNPVTVSLMQKENGVITATGQTAVLSEENGWTASFDNLEFPTEGTDYPYFVQETGVPGYITKYGEIIKKNNQSSVYWVPVADNQLRDGGTYLFRTNNSLLNVRSSGYYSNFLMPLTVTQNGPVTVGGVTYNHHLSDISENAVFRATASGSGFILTNIGTGNYLTGSATTVNLSQASIYTFNGGRLYSSTGNTGYLALQSSYYGNRFILTQSANNAASFQLYELAYEGASYETVIKNVRINTAQGTVDPDPELNKTIDYLGDGGVNPDTDLTGEEFYRLYLDVIGAHQPVDLLIVADMTSSMTQRDFSGGTRQAGLDAVVNGSIISGSGATAVRDTNGIIYNFMNMHEDNKVAVTGFSGGNSDANVYSGVQNKTYEDTKDQQNPVTLNWTSKNEFPNQGASPRDCYARVIRINEPPGTNYEAALMRSEELLSDPSVVNDGHLKVMIFLTDGEPNVIFQNGYLWKDNTQSEFMKSHTKDYFINFVNSHPDMVSYIVGISPDANSGGCYTLLSSIANEGHMEYFPADDVPSLQTVLQEIINRSKFSLVEITDHLSKYVEYYGEQPDVRVVRTDSHGNQTVVWDRGAPTENNFDDSGVQIIQSVTYEASGSSTSSGQVKVLFNPDCLLDGENRFTVSYNVKLSDDAKDQYLASGYNAVGEAGTDYGDNTTSSNKPGFRSNDQAFVTFTAYDIGHKIEYQHPVVQLANSYQLQIGKVSAADSQPLADAAFDLYKQCDAGDEHAVPVPGLTNTFGIKVNPTSILTNAQGKTEEMELFAGTYYLVETQAPDGFYAPTRPMAFSISADGLTVLSGEAYADGASAGETSGGVLQLVVQNQTSHPLPQTGGMPREIYILGGLLLMAGALIWQMREKQKAERRYD